ncbi:MAG: hypothetical protein ACFBWO_17445 [Paracoccaceae bacterium]
MSARPERSGTAHAATMRVGTEVGALMLYHPAALAAFEDWPIGWYDDAFAFEPVAREGRLVAWGTGGDGGFGVRLALTPEGAAPLDAAERARLVHVQDMRCDASLGTLWLDDGEGLPHEERRDDLLADAPERAFALPPGRYRARLHALDVGARDRSDADAVDYVVSFTPVDAAAWAAIAVPVRPPDLRPWPGEARDTGLLDGEARTRALGAHARRWLLPRRPAHAPDAAAMREILAGGIATPGRLALVPAPGLAVLPGERRTLAVTNDWLGWIWGGGLGGRPSKLIHSHMIAAPRLADGAPAVLCRVTRASRYTSAGTSSPPGRRTTMEVMGAAPVRLRYPKGYAAAMADQLRGAIGREPEDADLWGRERVMLAAATAPAPRLLPEDPPLAPAIAERLRADIDAVLVADQAAPVLAVRPGHHAHARAAVAAVADPAALVDWLLRYLDLPGETRLRLWDATRAERLAGMEAALERATQGRSMRTDGPRGPA